MARIYVPADSCGGGVSRFMLEFCRTARAFKADVLVGWGLRFVKSFLEGLEGLSCCVIGDLAFSSANGGESKEVRFFPEVPPLCCMSR